MSWHLVDRRGLDPATEREPGGHGEDSPAAAIARCPVAAWPASLLASDGRRVSVAEALGAGGRGVERLVGELASSGDWNDRDLTRLARFTPAGHLDIPVEVVSLGAGAERATAVDPAWLAAVDERRAAPRPALVAAGRGTELEAALHLTMLVATEFLDPDDDADVVQHICSGAMLWLLGGAVAWCLLAEDGGPFAPWARLVTGGWWPVGPTGGRLVLARASTRPERQLRVGMAGRV